MMSRRLTAVVFLAAVQSIGSSALAADSPVIYSLVFPKVKLEPRLNQAVEEITFSVACGHIDTVKKIPDLWNVEIQRAASSVEEFRASAGLGAARLINPKDWTASILVKQTDPSCFALSGSLVVSGEKYLQVPLSNANLRRMRATK